MIPAALACTKKDCCISYELFLFVLYPYIFKQLSLEHFVSLQKT